MLNHVFRNTAWTKPTNVFVSLHTADPSLTGANEVSAGWYARKQAAFAAATTSSVATNAELLWSAVTGAGVTVTHIGIFDALTTGNFLWSFNVTDKTFAIGQTPRIGSGNLTLTIDSNIPNYLIPKILDHLIGATTYSQVATVYCALYTSDPTVADSGTEVTGGSYVRKAITFGAASSLAIDSTADVDFGTASANWGTVTHYGIHDASTTGNLLIFGSLAGAGAVVTDDTVKIPSGSFDVTWV